MSLLVWLPLTQNLRNNGLFNITIINNGATIDNSGKLGKCYNFNNTSALSTQVDITKFGNNFSFCGWVNFSSTTSAQYIFHLGGGTSWQSKYALSEDYNGTIVYYLNGAEYKTSLSTSSTLNKWVHYGYTYDGTMIRIYINGSLVLSESRSPSSFTPTNNLTFGARANNTAGTAFAYGMQNGKLNDVRVYNHTLSDKEIKELSKGLVLHYPLSNSGDGADNLLPGTVQNETTYTYPTSSYSDKWAKKTAIIPSASTYTLSFYAKSTVNGDKIRVHYYNPNTTVRGESSQGAVSTSSDGNITFTLSTDWKKYWVTYAQNATTATKTIIFPRMGSTASYPDMSGTGIVSIRNVKFEEGNKSTVWKPNSTDPTYTSLNYNSTTEYDTSGNGYNGTKNGTFTYETNTTRHSISTKFSNSNYISLTSPTSEVKTVSFWAKWDSIPSGQSILFLDYKSRIGFGLASNGIIPGLYTGNYNTFDKSVLSANTWYHIVIVNTGTDYTSLGRKLYINGVEQTATSNVNYWTYSIDQMQIGKRTTSSDGLVGNMVDLRCYATALSADDIKELYQSAAHIDKNGNLFAYEFIED